MPSLLIFPHFSGNRMILGLATSLHKVASTFSSKPRRNIFRKTVETVSDFIFGGSKITADGDCSHEINSRQASDSSVDKFVSREEAAEPGDPENKVRRQA